MALTKPKSASNIISNLIYGKEKNSLHPNRAQVWGFDPVEHEHLITNINLQLKGDSKFQV